MTNDNSEVWIDPNDTLPIHGQVVDVLDVCGGTHSEITFERELLGVPHEHFDYIAKSLVSKWRPTQASAERTWLPMPKVKPPRKEGVEDCD